MLDPRTVSSQIEKELRRVARPARAAAEKRYLKSDLEFLGATVGEARRVTREFARRQPDLGAVELRRLVDELWRKPVHERRMVAVLLLDSYQHLLEPADIKLLEGLVRESKTWALVDGLAGSVLSSLLVRHPQIIAELDSWAVDDDFWVRRAALLAFLKPLRRGDMFEHFARYAESMLHEKEFFVRKAIGWALRETSKKHPDLVYEWLSPRAHLCSAVTIREAVKYLEPARRDEVLAAYRSR